MVSLTHPVQAAVSYFCTQSPVGIMSCVQFSIQPQQRTSSGGTAPLTATFASRRVWLLRFKLQSLLLQFPSRSHNVGLQSRSVRRGYGEGACFSLLVLQLVPRSLYCLSYLGPPIYLLSTLKLFSNRWLLFLPLYSTQCEGLHKLTPRLLQYIALIYSFLFHTILH